MNLVLDIQLSANTHYLESGNILSQLLMLKNTGGIVLVKNNREIKKYIQTAEFLNIPIHQITTVHDIIACGEKKSGLSIACVDILFLKLKDFSALLFQSGEKMSFETLKHTMNDMGYSYSDFVESGEFNISGDTLSIGLGEKNKVCKINFWGDTIESILQIDTRTQDVQTLNSISFGKQSLLDLSNTMPDINNEICSLLGEKNTLILDNIDISSSYGDILSASQSMIAFESFPSVQYIQENLRIKEVYVKDIEAFSELVSQKKYTQKYIISRNPKGVENFLQYNNISGFQILSTELNHLKSLEHNNTLILCDDVISRIFVKKRTKKSMSKNLDLLLQIQPGDYVVHKDHGIGIFTQIVEKTLGNMKNEYIEIQYKNTDRVFVPIGEVGRVNKYVGDENPTLTGLGGNSWEKKLKKVEENVQQVAEELLNIYAKRKLQPGFAHAAHEEEEIFKQSFEYTYTPDQIHIMQEIAHDMEQHTPMERLVCGDVGFGKTEIAFNALYKAVLNKTQCALISPLLVLAYEHFEKAKERFAEAGIQIEVLTRLESPAKVKTTLERLKNGKIDIIIGTHRLLSADIIFKKLGLLVIDEEHKFGVKDKEKIKNYRDNQPDFQHAIDILSLSATPIPRSLNMALSGIKSVSLLTTPPVGRKSVSTLVAPFDEELIQQAGMRELSRGGQIFFIHNEVRTIDSMAAQLQKLFPKKNIIVAHGQLPGHELENRIIAFKQKKYDILLATTVIENGIDFSDANTIFINNSHKFGISNIHQLRGRVGRSDVQGYCYLLFRKDTIAEDAAKRLQTMVQYSHLGSGFELAVKDLEIRGGGDILGIRQSGQTKDIGVNLYLEMLENKIEELKHQLNTNDGTTQAKNTQKHIDTKIDLPVSAYIDSSVFQSELDKINFYREVENIDDIDELENIRSDFEHMSPELSPETVLFFDMMKLKLIASSYKISHIKKVGTNYQIDFDESATLKDIRKFLDYDTQTHCVVITPHRIRIPIKDFANTQKFLQYLILMLQGKSGKKKMKLKK